MLPSALRSTSLSGGFSHLPVPRSWAPERLLHKHLLFSIFLQPSIPQVPNYRLSMTIPDWLQAIQNYMKTLQYPSNQGLSTPSQGRGMVIASLVANLSPAGHQKLSKVGEARHGGMSRVGV